MSMLQVVKYQALGNDFLVACQPEAVESAARALGHRAASMVAPDASPTAGGYDAVGELTRALCDRHIGVGADGLLIARKSAVGADIAMELRNADGGRAETSGNGLRCFALAIKDHGLAAGPEIFIETDAGVSRAVIREQSGPGSGEVSVDMGTVIVVRAAPTADPGLPGSRALPWPTWSVNAGNPHLVLLAPALEGVALTAIGPVLERRAPGGQNVEIVAYEHSSSELRLIVWERGAGATLACGSGSVAAAAALHSAGISPARVLVHNPGGTAEVTLSGDDLLAQRAELAGPVHRVARIELDPDELSESAMTRAAS